jgi:hypothetical protein
MHEHRRAVATSSRHTQQFIQETVTGGGTFYKALANQWLTVPSSEPGIPWLNNMEIQQDRVYDYYGMFIAFNFNG